LLAAGACWSDSDVPGAGVGVRWSAEAAASQAAGNRCCGNG
jgi:hypothetical protein